MDRLTERLAQSERRLGEIDQALVADELARDRVEEALSAARVLLSELEAEQEAAREQRAHWQVQEAHLAGSLRAAAERLERAGRTRAEAEDATRALSAELAQLETDTAALAAQQAEWHESLAEHRIALQELEAASGQAESELAGAHDALTAAE